MPTVNRSGVNIYYEVHGKGPALLLTHGYSATSEMWRDQIAALSVSHKVIVWDMRGHGRSDYPVDESEYSHEKTVEDMAALLDMAGVNSAIIAGLSLGGYMSLAFHLAYTRRVRALVIIDTGPGFRNDDARKRWNEHALEIANKLEVEGLSYLGAMTKERSTSSHRSADGLIRAARGMLTQRDASVIDSLPNITVPTLIIVGSNDVSFHRATQYMTERIPDARKIVIAGAGHAVNIDQPLVFNRTVRDFLESIGDQVEHTSQGY
jgi:pimeloyl-ACP methyl ester carboxylesterase